MKFPDIDYSLAFLGMVLGFVVLLFIWGVTEAIREDHLRSVPNVRKINGLIYIKSLEKFGRVVDLDDAHGGYLVTVQFEGGGFLNLRQVDVFPTP